jgi:hypothetical protein
MNIQVMENPTMVLAAAAACAVTARGADTPGVDDLVARIRSKDENVRGTAWQGAAPFGAAAIKPLAVVMADADFETARAAKRAIDKIVYYAGRPDSGKDRKTVAAELIQALETARGTRVRRELLWQLAVIAGDEAAEPVAALLKNNELREDARMVLELLPGKKSVNALKAGLKTTTEDFKPNIAESLRKRGAGVSGYPSQRLVPVKKTGVVASS